MMPVSQAAGLRIGAVSYLNSKPLIEGLEELVPDAELILDYPSRLTTALDAGQLDVALVPSVTCFLRPGYEVVSDACVAARGPVLSVKLFSRVAPETIQTLALDAGSRTSATLVQILLAERCGVRPRLESLPLESTLGDTRADAVLLIGDRCIEPPREAFHTVWDLAEEWNRWTGLPFVFAMWAARRDVFVGQESPLVPERGPTFPPAGGSEGAAPSRSVVPDAGSTAARDKRGRLSYVEQALTAARDLGVERLEAIARREAPRLGLELATTLDYLSQNLYYRLGEAERAGLKRFHALAIRHNLVPGGIDLVFREPVHRNLAPA